MSLSPAQLLRIKRDGGELSAEAIAGFVAGIGSGGVSEGQIGAFTMAVYQHGMTPAETAALTLAMRDSGDVTDWSGTGLPPRTLIEKHSSGGTGDEKVSLILAPLVAACGVNMPMISARGLGHTGGEIDLTEALGCALSLEPEAFRQAVLAAGSCIIGPSPHLAPADAAIYYVRDVTATVESVPLITSSILSKKLASGASGLVMSVNYGSAAFMPDSAAALDLAAALVSTAELAGLPMVAQIVCLDEVMGTAVGSNPQLHEVLAFLDGRARDPRMLELVMSLSSDILIMAGLAGTTTEAREVLAARLDDGAALDRFRRMVAAMGGTAEGAAEELWPLATVALPVPSPAEGHVARIDAFAVGMAMVALGAGRRLPTDNIDNSVGLTGMVHVGDHVTAGAPLCTIHAHTHKAAQAAADAVAAAITLSDHPTEPLPLITGRLTTNGALS